MQKVSLLILRKSTHFVFPIFSGENEKENCSIERCLPPAFFLPPIFPLAFLVLLSYCRSSIQLSSLNNVIEKAESLFSWRKLQQIENRQVELLRHQLKHFLEEGQDPIGNKHFLEAGVLPTIFAKVRKDIREVARHIMKEFKEWFPSLNKTQGSSTSDMCDSYLTLIFYKWRCTNTVLSDCVPVYCEHNNPCTQ